MDEIKEILLKEPDSKNDFEQREALAQAYAMKGFRDYLERSIRVSVASFVSIEDKDIPELRGRIKILKELLGISRNCFNEYEKIKNIKHANN